MRNKGNDGRVAEQDCRNYRFWRQLIVCDRQASHAMNGGLGSHFAPASAFKVGRSEGISTVTVSHTICVLISK